MTSDNSKDTIAQVLGFYKSKGGANQKLARALYELSKHPLPDDKEKFPFKCYQKPQ